MSQPIVVRCPKCSQKYRVGADKAGMKARCRCGQRFQIAVEQPVDEDTIFGWVVEGADPSSQSVLGGTSIFSGDFAEPVDHLSKPTVIDQTEPGVRLERLDAVGALFEFSARQLHDSALRNSFPRQCVSCGGKSGLYVHRVVWSHKLPEDDPLRLRAVSHQPVDKLRNLAGYGQGDWLSAIPKLRQLSEPFNLPFPFFACGHCKIEDEVVTAVVSSGTSDTCQICIANLEVATKFFRNNGGRNTVAYQRLVRESHEQKKDRWRSLPFAVRRQINQWITLDQDEDFRGFFPDAEFSHVEAGKAGVVLTSRRLSCHKYTTSREFAVSESGKIYLQPEEKSTAVRITQRGRKDATINLEQHCVEQLLGELRHVGRHWKVSGQVRTP